MWAPGLKGQVELFRLALLGRKPSSRSLYVIATGANDYRDDPFNVPMDPEEVARNIEEAIGSLYKIGARDVMVLNLPDLGKIPANMVIRMEPTSAAATEPADVTTRRWTLRSPECVCGTRGCTSFQSISTSRSTNCASHRSTTWPVPAMETIAPGTSPCLFVDPVDVPRPSRLGVQRGSWVLVLGHRAPDDTSAPASRPISVRAAHTELPVKSGRAAAGGAPTSLSSPCHRRMAPIFSRRPRPRTPPSTWCSRCRTSACIAPASSDRRCWPCR